MESAPKYYIVGIGDDGPQGLTTIARQLIHEAELIVGSEAHLAQVGEVKAEKLLLGRDLDEIVRRLSALKKKVVLLASGDPLFYGVARYLCDRIGKHHFEVLPHVSSMQLAFARVKESWEEAYLTNLANHPLSSVVEKIRIVEKAGLFTSDEQAPKHVASALLERGIDYFTAYVCENLGSPDERVTQGELADLRELEFSPLNVMILVRKPNVPDRPADLIGRRIFGNRDDAFAQSRPKQGLLTPSELRSIALAQLDLGPSSIVWDVGAGSGSVGIEAASIAQKGHVYAIEMDLDDYQLIKENAAKFGVNNLTAVLGKAPDAWKDLPTPDAIFVGGQGRTVTALVVAAFERLKRGGRLVTNVGSIENLAAVHELLTQRTQHVDLWMVNIARGTQQFERVRFAALTPSFLLAAVKE